MEGNAHNFIFAVVGPSGCGKSSLIEEMLRRFPHALVLMRSLTTRPRRPVEDDRSTRFVSRQEFLELKRVGSLIQWVEYDGNFYGDARSDVEEIFARGMHGIRPLVEDSVRSFRAQGYRVAMVKIVPTGDGYKNRSAVREKIDAERARGSVGADIEIANRFEPGGYEAACKELAEFIARCVG